MKKVWLMVLGLMLMASSAWAVAGTATQTLNKLSSDNYVWTVSWVDHGAGTTLAMSADVLKKVNGMAIELAVTNPGATAPTASYDITLVDADGVDAMGGALIDRNKDNSEQATPAIIATVYQARRIDGILTFTLANNSVNNALGTLKVFFKR